MAARRFPPPWLIAELEACFVVILFLIVATLWIILLYAGPKEGSSPQDLFVLSVVVVPFVMLIYFGLAVIICDNISVARGWPTAFPLQLSSEEILAAAVPYIGLTVWLWLRWRNCKSVKEGYGDKARRIARISPSCRDPMRRD